MRVLVTGGRTYADRNAVYWALDFLNPDHVITGGATGADALAEQWAKARSKKLTVVEAPWAWLGKRAGLMRNIKMLDMNPNIVLAFPGGKGTKHCVAQAELRNIPVNRVHDITCSSRSGGYIAGPCNCCWSGYVS